MKHQNKYNYKKIALVISLCVLIVWSALGAGTSLAWFSDSSTEIKNIVNVAKFDLDVTFRQKNGEYAPINDRTDVFDEKALYEPGYTQVVFLRLKNNGTVDFDYQTAVIIQESIIGTNLFGQPLNLLEHLRYGVVTADSEAELTERLKDRPSAQAVATEPLNDYYSTLAPLAAGKTKFVALIVYMPENVGNEANYRGLPQPKVKLGVSVTATQQQ